MNTAIVKAVFELESKLLTGIISEQLFQRELDTLLEAATDNKTIEFIKQHRDREI